MGLVVPPVVLHSHLLGKVKDSFNKVLWPTADGIGKERKRRMVGQRRTDPVGVCANKNPQPVGLRVFDKTGDTYFRAFGTIIGSESLTTVFGMGTGVTFPISSPEETRGAIKPPRACWLVVNSCI